MKEIINELIEIGLTEYEAKVYSTLLQQDLLSASDITKIGDVPRGRIYDIIDKLIEKGFCITVPGIVKKFKAVDPDTAIKNLIDQQKKKEMKLLEVAEKLREKYNNKKENATALDYITVLTSKQSQIKKFQELEVTSKQFILSFNKRPYAANTANLEEIKKFNEPFEQTSKKGVKAKAIYEADYDNPKNFIQMISYFEKTGEEVRICDKLPIKMLISDNNTVMLSLRNVGTEKFNLLSMVVEHSDLTMALINLFDFYWNTSKSIDEYIKSIKSKKIKKINT
jgi:sugar-specific transcriptional regulator TrmB